jgi:hypothetical protein
LKDFEAFKINFQRSGGFCKDYEAFKRHFQRNGGFFNFIWVTRLFEDISREMEASV